VLTPNQILMKIFSIKYFSKKNKTGSLKFEKKVDEWRDVIYAAKSI